MTEGSGKEKKHAAKESKRKNSSKHSSESTDLNGGYKEPPKDRKYFLKYPQAVWHIQASELPELDSKELEKDEKRILALKTESKQLYNKLAHEYEESTSLPNTFQGNSAQNCCSSCAHGQIRDQIRSRHSSLQCPSVPLSAASELTHDALHCRSIQEVTIR